MRIQGVAAGLVWAVVLGSAVAPAGAADAGDLIGEIRYHETVAEDTLLHLARRYDLGFVELVAANPGVDPWLPGAGVRLVLPAAHLLPDAPRRGIVINLAEQRLYFFPAPDGPVETFPLGTGRGGCETPLADTHITGKRRNPTWIPPPSIRAERPDLPAVVPPGPDNPLGDHALDLALRGYVIHGTNKPLGIGRRVSHGCIRMYPEDIARLFDRVAPGTPVKVVDQPVKVGWSGGALFLEVHPTETQADELEATGRFRPQPISGLAARVRAGAGLEADRLDWNRVWTIARERHGVPVRITR
jgi:L,D-transpeptidase ErfK/SrfK